MTDKALKRLIDTMKQKAEDAKTHTKEEAILELHKIGILTKSGKLAKPYRTPK